LLTLKREILLVSTSAAVLKPTPDSQEVSKPRQPLDVTMLAGIAVALIATVAGIASTGVKLTYFLQPTGALIVLGGTLGVTLITSSRIALIHSLRRAYELFWAPEIDREALIEEVVGYVKAARTMGLLGIEPMIERAHSPFLKESLLLALDVQQRLELQTALETKMRLRERQGEMDAKTLEVAGGFAPTIGVLGTVIGMIDVLRQFSNVSSTAYGVGTAFVSTLYGLGLANLVLLPAAHRIRARVAETFELHEMIVEGVLCIFDGIHPTAVRERMQAFLREK
jgi:chemotaxis protein MotA